MEKGININYISNNENSIIVLGGENIMERVYNQTLTIKRRFLILTGQFERIKIWQPFAR